jgi:hypothetical protein
MNNFNDLKATWQGAKTDSLPDAKAMMHIVKSFRDEKLTRKVWIILLSIGASVFFAVRMYLDRFHMASTLLAEALLIVSLLILAYTNIRSLRRFYVLNDCSNREFVNFLEQTRTNQSFYYRRTQVVCMFFYSLGLLLYLFELVHNDVTTMVTAYVATLALLIIYWTIVRPRTYQREALKLQNTIDQTRKIAQQFNEHEK